MKVALATDDGQRISAHFGRTRAFAIYELADGQATRLELRPNDFTGHALGHGHGHGPQGGHGHHSHGAILSALADCDVVICRGMGRRLVADFERAGKRVCLTDEPAVTTAASRYAAGTLPHNPSLGCRGGHHR